MTAQPIGSEDPHDPEQILRRLPESERERFLGEYRTAAVAAAHEVWRYKQLQEVLHVWSMKAVAYSRPDFSQRRRDAKEPTAETFRPASEVIPGWDERLEEAQ